MHQCEHELNLIFVIHFTLIKKNFQRGQQHNTVNQDHYKQSSSPELHGSWSVRKTNLKLKGNKRHEFVSSRLWKPGSLRRLW